MLENKKLSLSAKALLMGTLSTAAIVLSTSTANAATNESNAAVSEDQTTSLTNVETKNINNNQSTQRNEKGANQAAKSIKEDTNITEAPVGSAPVIDTPSSAADNSTAGDSSNNGSESVVTDNSINSNSQKKGTTQDTSEKPELKGKIKDIVKNSGINADDLNSDQINNLNKVTFEGNAEDGTKLTLNDLDVIGQALVERNPKYAVPYFNAKVIKNMDAAVTKDAQTGKTETLEIWDSWPVQDPITGYVSNYKGYQLVVAMMGMPKKNDNHIYLLYNKYNDNNFSHWRNAGSIFGYEETPDLQEWSGSAIVNKDGSIQLFYTKNDTSNGKINDQQLATANLKLKVDNNGVSIVSVDNDHVIFIGDGKKYQTYDQFANGINRDKDNYTLRDPHVVEEENGDRYLVFEANTGSDNYQGDNQVYNWTNYGGNDKFNVHNFLDYFDNDNDKALASAANGALGILKLSGKQNNPIVEPENVLPFSNFINGQ